MLKLILDKKQGDLPMTYSSSLRIGGNNVFMGDNK